MSSHGRVGRVAWRWGPVILCAGAIFGLSSVPLWKLSARLPPFPGADKIAHAVQYAVLGFVVCRAFQPRKRPLGVRYIILAILAAAVYGITDEIHQHYSPGRQVELWDAVADAVGSGIGALLWPPVSRLWPSLKP